MSTLEEYKTALKLGQKRYKQLLERGQYPFLPVLDEMLPADKTVAYTDLGVMMIPAEYIIGTKTAGRRSSFAQNFMPIAEERSEFAYKWAELLKSHLNEGIKDPILAYEYLNRYYVEEGNKRVSVLKFCGAVQIAAHVRRIMPERTGDPAIERYYEYVDFFKLSKVNYIEFSKSGSYKKFQAAVGKTPGEFWSEEDRRRLSTVYYYFRKVYQQLGGDDTPSSCADALLTYISIYDYQSMIQMSESTMRKMVSKVWEELTMQQEQEPIDLKMDPEQDKQSLISMITHKKQMKAAFVHRGSITGSSWVYGHELGRKHIDEVFGGQIKTRVYENTSQEDIDELLEWLVEDDVQIIFVTSSAFLDNCVKFAIDHPNIYILNCSIGEPHRYIRNYYIRMYEPKFITGAIAGAMCDNDKIGYICKYPIYGTLAEINAFARGVQMTNPRAKIYVEWSSVNGTKESKKRLMDHDIHYISFRDFIKIDGEDGYHFGLIYVNGEQTVQLASPVWQWGAVYERIIQSILNGTYRTEESKTRKSLAYYWGISSGAADMVYARDLPKGVRYMAEILYEAISEGRCHPFYNPQKGTDGKILWDTRGQSLSSSDVIYMNYLEENVVGTIPKFEDLHEDAKSVVEIVGVDTIRKEEG